MINLLILNSLLQNKGIYVNKELQNAKASESYVDTLFTFEDESQWRAVVPYVYRRVHLNLTTEKDIAIYLENIKKYFTPSAREQWVKTELANWEKDAKETANPDSLVTIEFFKVLASLKEEVNSFPNNSNPQRRIQSIKDRGYTVAVYPLGGGKWGKMLLPLPKYQEMGYETISPQLKSRIIRVLSNINAFEAKTTPVKSLIPDHKFPEVRWDEKTKADNDLDMSDEDIKAKFQLLDNQRNEQKREVCRDCFQTNKRGQIYGIEYFSAGTEDWDKTISTKGKDAEKGCIGCPWYDIEAWRKSLNEFIKKQNG